jgi:hypothetical protein
MGEEPDYLVELARAVASQRGYADFFYWPEKRIMQLGVLESFVSSVASLGLPLTESRLVDPNADPPDALAVLSGSHRVALELTEFVDQSLIERAKRTNQPQWRAWSQSEFARHLEVRVSRKDQPLRPHFSACEQSWLVIYIDEPSLTPSLLAQYLANGPPTPVRHLNRCFMLVSYDPASGACPVLEVPLGRAA